MKLPMYDNDRDPRRVGFLSEPVYSRRPRTDEEYVMEHFHSHAKRCRDCYDPYATHVSGRTLCDKGHLLAQDVARYMYSKGGRAYSMLDRESLRQRVQVEIPPHCDKVRGLLRAVDNGMRVTSAKPLTSLDRGYYVAARPDRRSYAEDRGTPVKERKRPREGSHRDYESRRYRSDPKHHYGDRYSYAEKQPSLPSNQSPYGSLWGKDSREKKRRDTYYDGNPFYYYKPSKGGQEWRVPRSESPKREAFRRAAADEYSSKYVAPSSSRRYSKYDYPETYRSSRYSSPDSYRSSGYASPDSYSSRRTSPERYLPKRFSWSPERLYREFFR